MYEYAAPGHALPKTWLKRYVLERMDAKCERDLTMYPVTIRYYMIFRTSEPSAVKIDLFPALRGGRSTPR